MYRDAKAIPSFSSLYTFQNFITTAQTHFPKPIDIMLFTIKPSAHRWQILRVSENVRQPLVNNGGIRMLRHIEPKLSLFPRKIRRV
jgi:hypothetical protein